MTVIIADEWETSQIILNEDNSSIILDKLLDEAGNILLDEAGNALLPENGFLENRPTLDLYIPDVNDEWVIVAGVINANKL